MISQPVSSIFLCSPTALWGSANSRPVHSLMLSSHLFFCLPCLLPPFASWALQDGLSQTWWTGLPSKKRRFRVQLCDWLCFRQAAPSVSRVWHDQRTNSFIDLISGPTHSLTCILGQREWNTYDDESTCVITMSWAKTVPPVGRGPTRLVDSTHPLGLQERRIANEYICAIVRLLMTLASSTRCQGANTIDRPVTHSLGRGGGGMFTIRLH